MQEKIKEEKRKYKVAVISATPFHYHVGFYNKIFSCQDIDLHIYFCSDNSYNTKNPADGRITENELDWGWKYEFLKNYSFSPSFSKGPFGLLNFGIWKKIKYGEYDAVILQAWNNFTWWLSFLACRKFNAKVFFMTDANILSKSRNTLKEQFKNILLRYLFKNASGFLATGKSNEQMYSYYGADKNKMAPLNFSWGYEHFIKENDKLKNYKKEIRRRFEIMADDFVFLFVGRLAEKKDCLIF